ncbi:MAG: cytochrome c4 [Gammaproteobacteria bacterium]|nr:MAG: cytochrome c4 [Gammaproteobacteria bacterium]
MSENQKRHRTLLISIAACFLVVAAMPVSAAGDVERGAILAETCMGCHGIPGYRNGYPSYRVPKLGGQHEDYLVIGLQGYKTQGRGHPTMQAQAAGLSDQDMRDLAAYFASQGGPEQGSAQTGARIERGREKAGACAACHGEVGISLQSTWPSLAGQHEDYMREVILQYKNQVRTDPVMQGQAQILSDEDIADLAAFYAAQPGLFTVEYAR